MKPIHHVLLVEDNPIAQRIPKIILEEAGYRVKIAACGQAAFEAISQSETDFDIILLDIGLPDHTGFEVAQSIRKADNYKHTPIIGLTAHITNENETRYMNEIVSKPFTTDLLTYLEQRYLKVSKLDVSDSIES